VASPQRNIVSVEVIFDGGTDDSWALAEIMWREDKQTEARERVGIRWNGNDKRPKGNPTSRGFPTWFMLPENLIAEMALAHARERSVPAPNE
jgi:hypothetical protein